VPRLTPPGANERAIDAAGLVLDRLPRRGAEAVAVGLPCSEGERTRSLTAPARGAKGVAKLDQFEVTLLDRGRPPWRDALWSGGQSSMMAG
jgi:hypothetical protein